MKHDASPRKVGYYYYVIIIVVIVIVFAHELI